MIRGCWIVCDVLLLRLTPYVEDILGDLPSVFWLCKLLPIPEAAWFKAWVCDRPVAGIAGSDSAGDVSVVYCQVEFFATGRSLVQRSPTECGVSNECNMVQPKHSTPAVSG
jgi:hypothetical protein